MNFIYNNIKGVIGAICMMSVLFSTYSCSQGTDEELISKELDASRMDIHPRGCIFFVDDTLDSKPDEMIFLINRVLKTWATAFTAGFEEEIEDYKYIGNIIDPLGDSEEIKLVSGTYHAVGFTHDEEAFKYNDVYGFLFGNKGVTQIGLEYQLNSGFVKKPIRLFTAYVDNYVVDEYLDDDYFKLDAECLTQRYEWEFYIKKTDNIACIDAIEAEIDGVPCKVDLRSKSFDATDCAKVKAFGTLTHESQMEAGRDTVRISVDVFPLIAPSHVSKLNLVEENVGNLKVRMTITSKYYDKTDGQWKLKSKDWLVRHRMDELDSIPVYDLHDDMVHISKREDAPNAWKYKIEDDILINQDTINTRRYGKWQVIK